MIDFYITLLEASFWLQFKFLYFTNSKYAKFKLQLRIIRFYTIQKSKYKNQNLHLYVCNSVNLTIRRNLSVIAYTIEIQKLKFR